VNGMHGKDLLGSLIRKSISLREGWCGWLD